MIRLYFLCCYFDKFHGRRGGSLQYYDDFIDRHEFINHLLNEKHLGEDIRESLKRWLHGIIGVWISQGGRGQYRMQKCRRMVFDLMEVAEEKGLLIKSDRNSAWLRMDYRGRRFMKPLNFIEACAKEYGYLKSVFTSFLIGISGTLFLIYWNKIITFLAN